MAMNVIIDISDQLREKNGFILKREPVDCSWVGVVAVLCKGLACGDD